MALPVGTHLYPNKVQSVEVLVNLPDHFQLTWWRIVPIYAFIQLPKRISRHTACGLQKTFFPTGPPESCICPSPVGGPDRPARRSEAGMGTDAHPAGGPHPRRRRRRGGERFYPVVDHPVIYYICILYKCIYIYIIR